MAFSLRQPAAASPVGRVFSFALMAGGAATAWVAQSAIHFRAGRGDPPLDAFGIPGVGGILIEAAAKANPAWVYGAGVFLFGAGALLGRAWQPAGHAFLSIAHEPEGAAPRLHGHSRVTRAFWWFLACVFVAFAGGCWLFAMASARAEVAPVVPFLLPRTDRLLRAFYGIFGLTERPDWWLPFLAWVGVVPSAAGLIWAAGRALGYAWGGKRPPAARRLWEWAAVGAMCILSLHVYLYRIEIRPWVVQQDEGIVGRTGYFLTKEDSTADVFADPFQPNPAFITRGLAARVCGNRHEPLRYVSALTGAAGILALYLLVRSFADGVASVMAAALWACCHTMIQYSRLGLNNVDSMVWIVITLCLHLRAERTGPGTARIVAYLLTGAAGAGAFGMYPGTKLGFAVVLGIGLLRAIAQPRFLRRRGIEYATMIAMAVLLVAPFRAVPGYAFQRQNQVYMLSGEHLTYEFTLPDIRGRGIDTVEELVAHYFKSALGAYHVRRDNSHDYSTPFPLAGPMLGALGLLGGLLLLSRPKTWGALAVFGLFLGGCLLGGALRHSPAPPSSARLLMLAPALAAAAAVAIDAVIAAGIALRPRWPRTWAALGLLVLAGLTGSEAATNRALYKRYLGDPGLYSNRWMRCSTELQRFLYEHHPKPDLIVQYDVDYFANQSFIHNDYYLPGSEGKRHWIDRGKSFHPGLLPPRDVVLFLFHWERGSELAAVEKQFPGGKHLEVRAPDAPGGTLLYLGYELELPVQSPRITAAPF
ncbi:glycosyltransferase family 39 protein, partial [Candidatus Poribacteria bacterium]|nr:glycosyltransferase family 39 protein [Candidatus Poribacteria bacterium]